jgi:DNA-binding transcriptional regulator YdaS (Cro superfamily)
VNKQKAIDYFGSVGHMAGACNVTPSAVSQWPDPLPRYAADKVLAAIIRQGRIPPSDLLPEMPSREAV